MKRHLRIAVMNSMRGFSAKVIRGIQKYARPAKPWIIQIIPPEAGAVKAVAAWQPDGILAQFHSEAEARAVCALKKPVVNYGFKLQHPGLAHLGQDDAAIGRMAADYFLQRGFRNFAYIGDNALTFSRHRGTGFARAVQAAGHACYWYREKPPASSQRAADPWSWRDESIRRWVLSLPRQIAVLACNDRWGWQMSEVCLTAGIAIPENLALLGVDNDELLCEMAYPTLSSVDTLAERIGFRGAAILDKLMAGGKVPKESIIFQPQRVVTRGSSDSFAITDADVAAAVRFIRENIETSIGVESVVEHTAISRRALERKFLQSLRRTPLEEIHRARIERAKILLSESDLPLPHVIAQCGFRDRQRFSALFKRHTNLTASAYRKRMRRESS